MNAEACIKCNNERNRKIFGWRISYCCNSPVVTIFAENNTTKKREICSKDIETPPSLECEFDKITLAEKNCPYWIEHMIFDWNKK